MEIIICEKCNFVSDVQKDDFDSEEELKVWAKTMSELHICLAGVGRN